MPFLLKIEFPDNLRTESLIKQANIPCLCKIGKKGFEIEFRDPQQHTVGLIETWDMQEINNRSPAGAGGEYIHYSDGLITLEPIHQDCFEVIGLDFFCGSSGWHPIIRDKKYA